MTQSPKPKTKKAQLIQLLTRKAGADVATISDKLGWQAHTTRAALTGLRKAGFEISAEKSGEGKPLSYRITAQPADAA
jgi:predicted ArsR family transcriptional regulator